MTGKINPKISIITPVLNGAKTIEQTINSVLKQSYRNIEYIIIDGGSTDGTVNIIKHYAESLSFWNSTPDSGISDAFNKGVLLATGEIIGIINSDDWYELNAISLVVKEYIKNPEIDIFYGKTNFLYSSSSKLYPTSKLAHVGLFYGMALAHPSIFVQKRTYNSIGLFDLSYKLAMDYDFLLRSLLENANFKFIDHHLSNFRHGGLSYRYYQEGNEECQRIRQTLFKRYNIYS